MVVRLKDLIIKENYEVTVSADVSNVVFDYAVINSQAKVNVIGDNNLKMVIMILY